jgi:hypothetical protein
MMIQFYTLATGKSTPSSDTPLSPHHLNAKFSPVSFSASWNVLSVMVATRWSNAWQTLRASMDKLCLSDKRLVLLYKIVTVTDGKVPEATKTRHINAVLFFCSFFLTFYKLLSISILLICLLCLLVS